MRRWEGRYEKFNPVHYPNHHVTKAKKEQVAAFPRDQLTWCPLVREYGPNIHYAVAQLRVLDGSIPVHPKHGAPVNFFAPAGAVKFWVTSTHTFGFFLYYTLDKVVCLYLANLFGMHIFHPTTEEEMKALPWTLQWACAYFAGVERATRNKTNGTHRLLKKY